jgi:hypothetical protein
MFDINCFTENPMNALIQGAPKFVQSLQGVSICPRRQPKRSSNIQLEQIISQRIH